MRFVVRRLLSALVAIALASSLLWSPASAAPPSIPCPPGSEWELLTLVNNFRAQNGKPALVMSAELNLKAQSWTEKMIAEDNLYHSNLSIGVSGGWSGIAENIAYNGGGVSAAQTALQNSSGHRTNLLGNYGEVGLGIAVDSGGTTWVTEVFVLRSSPSPIYTGPAGASAYVAVTPTELFDTTGGGQLAAGTQTSVQVANSAGVPVGASAAVVTLEAVAPTGPGYLQLLGPGATVGSSSNLNVYDGNVANTAIVPLDANGRVTVFNSVRTHIRITVTGYFAPIAAPIRAGRYSPITPARLLDTRSANGYSGARPVANQTVTVQITGRGGVPSSGVSSVIVNLAGVQSDGVGEMQVGASPLPAGSWRNLYLTRPGNTIANVVIVPLDAQGRLSIRTTVGSHMVVDVQGWFTASTAAATTTGLYVPMVQTRALDTRYATGIATRTPVAGPVGLNVPGSGNMPDCPRAVVGNLAIIPSTPTYTQVGPHSGFSYGAFASINADSANRAIANAFVVSTGAFSWLVLFAPQSTHMIADLSGWFS